MGSRTNNAGHCSFIRSATRPLPIGTELSGVENPLTQVTVPLPDVAKNRPRTGAEQVIGIGFKTGRNTMTDNDKKARLPPRWVVRTAWYIHRRLYKFSGGRFGLRRPKPGNYGMMNLTVTGRRSGQERSVILGYFEDGPNLVTMAMNGWSSGEPAWWLNLQANPLATVHLPDGPRPIAGRAATGDERERLWEIWRGIDDNLDGYAALRSSETAVVVLEPNP